jgi:hypothetical protein
MVAICVINLVIKSVNNRRYLPANRLSHSATNKGMVLNNVFIVVNASMNG